LNAINLLENGIAGEGEVGSPSRGDRG
jgi:hypothetical protein